MENPKPSSSPPPYSGLGAGGKFKKPPISRKRPATPYDRPSLPPRTTQSEENNGGGWLSKLVVNPARRLIIGGANRILPSFFTKSESSSSDEFEDNDDDSSDNHDDDEEIDATENAYVNAKHGLELGVSSYSGDAGPSNEMDKLKGSTEHNVQQDKSKNTIGDLGFDRIEEMLKGKQFSRDESNRLMEILESRLADVSNAEGEKKAASLISQGQAKADVLDHEIPSTLTIAKRYEVEKAVVETPRPRLQSNMQDEVAASPIDLARAYMGSRTSDLGFNTYNNISTDRREHQHNDLLPSKSHFLTPSSKSSTCWPGAMVQDQRGHLTPQTQRGRYGLHNFPRTPYSRTIYSKTKPKLNQLQGDNRSSNISLTPFQQSQTPNPWQRKTTNEVMDSGYGSVGPIRRVRNKFATEPRSEGPRSISSAQNTAGTSFTSRSFVPVFQKNSGTSTTSNLYSADKPEQNSKLEANSTGPNETVRKILEQLDRHKPTPKEKAAELKLATEWRRSPSQDTNLMPKKSTNLATGSDLLRNVVSSDYRSLLKGTDGAEPLKTTNEANKTSGIVIDAGAAPSFAFRNTGVANETSTFTHIKGKEKTQPSSLDNPINGQDLTKKRASQPILKPISFNRPDPQHVISSDHGRGFTFQFSTPTNSASEPPTPTITPSFLSTTLPQSTELPTFTFGAKKTNNYVFSFPSTSSSAPVDDGESDLKFVFRSDKNVSFASKGSDGIVIS